MFKFGFAQVYHDQKQFLVGSDNWLEKNSREIVKKNYLLYFIMTGSLAVFKFVYKDVECTKSIAITIF